MSVTSHADRNPVGPSSTRCLAASKSEGVGEPVIAAVLGNALEGGASREQSNDRQCENGSEVVNPPPGSTRIENAIEHLDKSNGHGGFLGKALLYPTAQLSPTSILQ